MSYSSKLTRNRILKCAEKEFLEKGFSKANLREIATSAKATTGALYNHFQNKEVLFDELVKKPADTLLDAFQKMHMQVEQEEHRDNVEIASDNSSESTDWMLDYIYDNFTAFKLIFCCSEGTAYSSYIDELVKIEEASYHKMLAQFPGGETVIDDFFLHVMAASGLREIYEVVSHGLTKEAAKKFIENVKRFRFAGWRELLGEQMR